MEEEGSFGCEFRPAMAQDEGFATSQRQLHNLDFLFDSDRAVKIRSLGDRI